MYCTFVRNPLIPLGNTHYSKKGVLYAIQCELY